MVIMVVEFVLKVLVSIAVVGFVGVLLRLYDALVVKPRRIRSFIAKQGISGPPPAFLLGNIMEIKKARARTITGLAPTGESPAEHNCASVLFPFLEQWRKHYGEVFAFALGNTQILCVNQPDVVKEITTCTSLDFGKPLYQSKDRGPLFGEGILTSNGSAWAHQRKILAPELYMDKVKGMVKLVTECAMTLVNSWNGRIETAEGGTADIKIDNDIRRFSVDVISRVCFGRNFSEGQRIFYKLRDLEKVMSKTAFYSGIPGARYLPTKINKEAWGLQKEVATMILNVVKERTTEGLAGNHVDDHKDLLQIIIEGADKGTSPSPEATDRFIVDNCKNIYLAAYDAVAASSTWCLMLLAANQNWQDRVRAEVLQVCKGSTTPDADMLKQMKQLTMVIHETLRLYPPATVISREAFKDMKFGDVDVPKGSNVWTMVTMLHTDPKVWGDDSYNFKPDRFANGVSGACKFPYLYMPFGVGPRVCIGQHLAMIELKTLLALILSNFSFSLSPNYRHSPTITLIIEPKLGVDLLVNKL